MNETNTELKTPDHPVNDTLCLIFGLTHESKIVFTKSSHLFMDLEN